MASKVMKKLEKTVRIWKVMEFEKDSQKSWNVVSSLINNNQVLTKKDDKNRLRRIFPFISKIQLGEIKIVY